MNRELILTNAPDDAHWATMSKGDKQSAVADLAIAALTEYAANDQELDAWEAQHLRNALDAMISDCSIIDTVPLTTPISPAEHATPRGTATPPEPATPQPMSNRLIAPAFSAQSSVPSTLAWYLIHTKPRQEALALTNLSRQGFECYMPMLRLQKIRQRKTALVAEPMFPRYLFIRLDTSGSGQSWSPIRSTLGVNQLVRFGGQPAKVDGQLIDLIRSREQGTHAQPLFTAGDNVTVADGPFAGLEAIYQNTDAESRSMILLNILSKPVAMRIDTVSLRKTG